MKKNENATRSASQAHTASSRQIQKAYSEITLSVTRTGNTIREKMIRATEVMANFSMVCHGARRFIELFSSAWGQAAKFENIAVRLEPLVGDLRTAKDLANDLRDEAANGTVPFEKLASTAGKLASVFQSTENIKRWTSAFHNMAVKLAA